MLGFRVLEFRVSGDQEVGTVRACGVNLRLQQFEDLRLRGFAGLGWG